jgi:hypothetical protein
MYIIEFCLGSGFGVSLKDITMVIPIKMGKI